MRFATPVKRDVFVKSESGGGPFFIRHFYCAG